MEGQRCTGRCGDFFVAVQLTIASQRSPSAWAKMLERVKWI